MHSIITITLNPSIDKSTTASSIVPEKKIRCTEPAFEPGGGGINVARAIKKLGGNALAIYTAGGYSGKFLNILLENEHIDTRVIETNTHTRENMIVLDTSTHKQYRFGMPGAELSEPEWKACLQAIEEQDEAQYIVASGSLPPGVPDDVFAQIARIAKHKNARFIADTSGAALKQAATEGVYLLKPNLGELSSLVGKEELSKNEIEESARQIIAEGKCKVVVVSLGADGALLVNKNQMHRVEAPKVKLLSTVGAGDCMVAGIVLSLSKGANLKEALQYGVACGTAATMNPGTELCKPKDVQELLAIIKRAENQ